MGEYRYLVGGVFAGGVEGAALSFEEGELIKNRDGSEVYLVKGAKLRHLKDEDAYRFFVNRCFIRFDREVSKSGLDGFGAYGEQLVAPSSYTQCPAEGALVMSICLPNVYLFEGGKFRWVEDEYTFRNKGYRFSDVNVISERLIPTPYGPSVCGGLGGPIKVQNPADPVPDTARHRALLDFGFGQAVVMNGAVGVAQNRFRIVAVVILSQGTLAHGVIELADEPPVRRQLVLETVFPEPGGAFCEAGIRLLAVVRAGANTINGISFDLEDRVAAEKEARQLAIEDAKAKAVELAGLAGVELGQLYGVNVYSSGPSPVYEAKGGAALQSGAPIAAGQMVIQFEANLSYEIK